MALPKKLKGWRKIHVEGQSFLWMPATIVYPLDSQLTKLIIDSGFIDPWLNINGPNKKHQNNPAIIKPKFVAEAIKFALDTGWMPSLHKGEFKLKYVEGRFQFIENKL